MALSIRERQRALTRDAIRDAAIEVASETGFAAMTMDKVAEQAGVSPSTVYRYFADRETLLAAIVAWNSGQMAAGEVPLPSLSSAADVAGAVERLMVELDGNRALNRAIVVSRVGHEAAWTGRQEHLDLVRRLLEEVTGNLDPEEARSSKAVIAYLFGGLAWLTMADESGLEGAQAGRATAWAIRTLIADLRARNDKAATRKAAAEGNHRHDLY